MEDMNFFKADTARIMTEKNIDGIFNNVSVRIFDSIKCAIKRGKFSTEVSIDDYWEYIDPIKQRLTALGYKVDAHIDQRDGTYIIIKW